METTLLFLFIAVLFAYIFSLNTSRKFQGLDNESKLKLFELNLEVRKIYNIALLIIIAFFYTVVKLDLFNIYIPFILTIIVLSIYTTVITNKKSRQYNIPQTYTKRANLNKNIALGGFLAFSLIYYYSADTDTKTASDYQYDAQLEMELKHYDKAVDLYTNSIQLDSTNSNCYYNCGCCKYFIHDTIGACKDWRKANDLGETKAAFNLRTFCK